MQKTEHLIKTVLEGGIAEEMGVEPGMSLISINGNPVRDVLDYRFLMSDTHVDVTIKDLDGNETVLDIDKDPDEDFGVEFETPFMDDYRHCSNRCIFCFIDQMPKGMRRTLYFKDDDARLSFLQGNYVTLTNMSAEDVERICRYKMEPINISVHTTNPELRNRMLGNPAAGESLSKLDAFKKAGIVMNGQIVLCRGWNDGDELDSTLSDLEKYRPEMQSVSVVPVGLTKFREGLTHLDPFDRESARRVIAQIAEHPHYVYASDEWFLLAGYEIPEADYYDDYPQIENGVGMLRSLYDEVKDAQKRTTGTGVVVRSANRTTTPVPVVRVSVVCGMLFAPFMKKIAEMFPDFDIRIYSIRNEFFGEGVTVSGLLTGQDILKQLKGKELGERMLVTVNMLRSGETVLLDDLTVRDLENELHVPVIVTGQSGYDLADAIKGNGGTQDFTGRQVYES
jgi:putative radical SAM enzyme (TIGR03279 family)